MTYGVLQVSAIALGMAAFAHFFISSFYCPRGHVRTERNDARDKRGNVRTKSGAAYTRRGGIKSIRRGGINVRRGGVRGKRGGVHRKRGAGRSTAPAPLCARLRPPLHPPHPLCMAEYKPAGGDGFGLT